MARDAQGDTGFVDVDSTLALRKPELRVNIDREKAADLGIRVEDIAETLRTLVGGEPVSKYKEADEQYDVWLRADAAQPRRPARDLRPRRRASPNGELVRLSNLVTLDEARGPAQIDRFAPPAQGRRSSPTSTHLALGDAVKKVDEIVAKDWTCRSYYGIRSAAAPSRSRRPAATSSSRSC